MSSMKEGSSLHEEMIERNWVLKRKRKHISSGLDASTKKQGASVLAQSAKSSSSLGKKLKRDLDASQKIKGHDGYYFECEECALGGNLLCCDSCPRTYHLDCLKPPLKRAPPGKWQCPKCCEQKDDETLINIETSSRRARSNNTIQKAKAMHSISSGGKGSHSSRSSIGSNKSTSKRKASFSSGAPAFEKKPSSSSMKSSPSDNLLMVGTSETADGKTKKKAVSPPRRKISVQKVCSLAKSSNSNASGKSIEEPDAYKNGNHGNKLNIPAVLSSRISKKNRKMICRIEKNKRSKADNVENVRCVSNDISNEASPCPESGGPPQKCNPTDNRSCMSKMKQERRLLMSARQKQLEVDRILGCRVRAWSSCIDQKHGIRNFQEENKAESDSESLQTKLPSSDSTSQVNHDPLDECCNDSRVLDMKESKDTLKKGCQDGANSIAHKINGDGSNVSDVEANGRELATSGHMGKTEIIRTLVPQSSVGHCMTSNVSELPEDSVGGDENIKARAAKKVSEGSIVEFLLVENCSDHQSPALAELPVPCESEAIHVMITGSRSDHSAENVIQNEPTQELKLEENDSVTYEYFVKWVGKSNIHNSWVTEDQLKLLAKRKLENYKAKYGTSIINICEEQWCQPQRIIGLHESPHAGGEALVKWCGLPYDECTWEKLDDPVVQSSSHLISEFKQFETQTFDNDARDDFVKVEIQEVVSLAEQPKELKGGSLFPHQLEALNWLRRCWHKSKNVILADEMGLGKTVSASSFISSLYCEFKVKLPSLVLVPLSTMPNWLAEFASWAPHLNVVEYHGCAKARSIIREYEWHASNPDGLHKMTKSYKFNVLLTTYEMILADSSYLRGVPWEVLVVDEGHRLKNSGSKLFNLLNAFSVQHCVLLTGTPLQNNIGEMYNLLNFLQPASFPSLSAFEQKFDELTTAEKVEELKKLVAPHMLRRLKKDAMRNIPPKTERMVPVELTSIQAEYYRAMLTKNYQILRNIGKGVAQQSMLNIVMQLRKVCNHPYLIPGTEPESGTVGFLQEMRIKASAKLTLLHSMLKILHKDGHRVLIFSQMTKLLDILEDYLTIEFGNGTFERVDGSVSVTDRQAAISRFNQDKTRFVFLLSTRSCGLGINLATADTVIIYDSDFNPHADIQAMNRAHRIGQSNRLLVYRLVVRASVEERILQLAKKKLMLDQLFVNKSGSQKEVEDIIRWGTEELFGDCDGANGPDSKDNSIGKVDASADGEQKHRRKVGGLGDVYKDRCTDGGVKTVWDEGAILKLLDRSDLQTAMTENADGDLDNDMLGSVKSLDWSDDQINEEPNSTEMMASLAGDGLEPSETKEEIANTVTEENEWDRILRVRWEKYQLVEEATLGRGKRTRKAVSYRETFASIPSEALSENANEDEEPEREYTPAGRALKEKYMKLRARQKERIKRKHAIELHSSAGPESLKHSAFPYSKEMQHSDSNIHLEDSNELDTSTNPDDSKDFQPFDMKNTSYWISKKGRTVKHDSHLSLSVRPPDLSSNIIPPSNHLQSASSANCVPTSMLLPVLGLCAPNASQRHTSTRILNSPPHHPAPNHEQRRTTISAPEFPSASTVMERPLTDSDVAGEGTNSLIFSESPEETLYRRLKNIIPDSYFPFGPPLLPTSGRSPSDAIERLGTSFSSFREKLGLPNLVADDVPPLKFALPSLSSEKLHTEFLPNLLICSNIKLGKDSEDLSNVPLVPSFGRQLNETLKQKQVMPELPLLLNLGLAQTSQPFPENHRKVLDNIMMRTQTAAHKFTKKRLKVDAWSEDELDALWIGVRRHGKDNWDAMLGDPKLKILKHRSVEELLSKWTEEQNKIMDGSVPPPKKSKSASFLGLSDGMMTRALLGSKFANLGTELPKFCSHLTDMQLGGGDIMPNFPFLDPSCHLGATSESFLSLPSWQSDNLGSKYIGNFSAGSVDRLEKANLPLEQPFRHSSLSGNAEALGMNLSSSNSLQQKDDVSARNKRIKLPSLLEKSLHLLRETQNIHSEGSSMGFLHDAKKKQVICKSTIADDSVPDGLKANKLPHWLREAFSAPRHPEPALPPSVSAISQSVHLLYGEDKSMFPPFVIPNPPPLPPKDPRERLRKKRKLHRLRQAIPHNSNTMGNVDISASCSIPAESHLLACSNSSTPPLMGYSVPPAPRLTPPSIPRAPSLMPSTISSAMLAPHSIPPELPVPSSIPTTLSSLPSFIPTTLSLLPSFIATTLPLMPSSLPSAPSMMPFKFPSTLPWLPSSIPQAPPLMQSCVQPPPALPSSILPVPTLLPSSISLSPPSMLGSIPPLPQMMQSSIPVELPPMPCTIPPAPPLTASLPSIPRKETGFILSSLNLNLNSPSSSSYGAQEMQPVATASPCPAMFQLVAPGMDHAPSLSSRPDMPSSSYPNSEVPASNIPEYSDRAGVALIGDFKNIDMKQKAIMSSHVGCVGKLNGEHVDRTESGKLGKMKSNSSLADDIKSLPENSSERTVADDNRSEQEP